MKCLDVFAVNTMNVPFVFSNPALVPSSFPCPQATGISYRSSSKDISEGKEGNSQHCLGI